MSENKRNPQAGLAEQARLLLAQLLEQEGVSIYELAQKSGVSHMSIRRVLKGEQVATLDSFDRMLSGFGLTASIQVEPN